MNNKFNDAYILDILFSQLKLFNVSLEEQEEIALVYDKVKLRFHRCLFSAGRNQDLVNQCINPYNAEQWCIFLYFLSNSLFRENKGLSVLCDKIYYLNKVLNSCDIYYEVNLPDIFLPDHPFGVVIGRASFKNYFSFSKGCTVGNNNGIFPEFGENVTMLDKSKVIGKSKIGNNVIVTENTFIKDDDIPDNCMVFGTSPSLIIMGNQVVNTSA